jgi:hypothetical protein
MDFLDLLDCGKNIIGQNRHRVRYKLLTMYQYVHYIDSDIGHRDFVLNKIDREKRVILCCSLAKAAGGKITVNL